MTLANSAATVHVVGGPKYNTTTKFRDSGPGKNPSVKPSSIFFEGQKMWENSTIKTNHNKLATTQTTLFSSFCHHHSVAFICNFC